eukprot:1500450-Amphidinium_carterae.1
MSWNATDVAKLMNVFAAMQKMSGGKPGNWGSQRRSPSTLQDKPGKDFAGTSWNCTVCGFYNFGYAKTCFQAGLWQCDGSEAAQDLWTVFKARCTGCKAWWTGWKGRSTAHKDDVRIKGDVFPEAPFRIGPHMHVVRHETFIQCRDCGRQTGKVRGDYNFAYRNRQNCRQLKKKTVKVGPSRFAVAQDNRILTKKKGKKRPTYRLT